MTSTPDERERQVLDRIDRARRRRPRVREERVTMSHGAGGKATRLLPGAILRTRGTNSGSITVKKCDEPLIVNLLSASVGLKRAGDSVLRSCSSASRIPDEIRQAFEP